MKTAMLMLVLAAGLLVGCGTPSWETGERDPDDFRQESSPASLVEVTFGGGHSEVTKNLPGEAAQSVGDAVKTLRGRHPPDVSEP
ncbi:MAG TPA: hypothetical protein PKE26_10285 [Kiritimatiellia bacterium]|nr:hypothetical protein [Kiritimatiellia bacterium]HMO99486.1 hypothetical protein [Kiritimatiellia bacterium]